MRYHCMLCCRIFIGQGGCTGEQGGGTASSNQGLERGLSQGLRAATDYPIGKRGLAWRGQAEGLSLSLSRFVCPCDLLTANPQVSATVKTNYPTSIRHTCIILWWIKQRIKSKHNLVLRHLFLQLNYFLLKNEKVLKI